MHILNIIAEAKLAQIMPFIHPSHMHDEAIYSFITYILREMIAYFPSLREILIS